MAAAGWASRRIRWPQNLRQLGAKPMHRSSSPTLRSATLRAMVTERDVDRVAEAARGLPPAVETYFADDFVMNLLATMIDYQMNATAVVKAFEFFRTHRWDEVRTIDDIEELFAGFSDDEAGYTALAQHLW